MNAIQRHADGLRWAARAILVASCLLPAATASALVIHSGNNNNTPPGVPLAGSGWQYQGDWGSALGTTIGPHHFISATHLAALDPINVGIGKTFTFNGTPYTTIAVFDDPGSDLSIWEVSGTFPTYAELYPHSDESGKDLVVFGRGRSRDAVVSDGSEDKGWDWKLYDGVQRWGTNTVSGVGLIGSIPVIAADFNDLPGTEETHLASWDSGGGVFIQDAADGNTWKLAGVNYTSECCFFNTTGSGTGFPASLYDAGGMYFGPTNAGPWSLIADEAEDLPTSWFASRVSERLDWIESVVVPEPSGVVLLVVALGLFCVGGWRRR